jgi:hypothetical protein
MQQGTLWLPSTCYLVCGSRTMAARHNCNAGYLLYHAVFTVGMSYTALKVSLLKNHTAHSSIGKGRMGCGIDRPDRLGFSPLRNPYYPSPTTDTLAIVVHCTRLPG